MDRYFTKLEIDELNLARSTKDPKILMEILRKGENSWACGSACLNPNCPLEMLVEVLRRGKEDDVSWNAYLNPNCPLEEKIKWMQVTGQIEKEDESKGHIIEYENNKEDDFQDLKDLLKNC
jgi:hypothetical protein